MLIRAEASSLLVVDVQQKLVPAIHDGAALVERVVWLVRVAQRLGVPVAATEHYPAGLGPAVEALRALIPASAIAEKVHFSCAEARCLAGLPGADRRQVVIAGMEAHVCVMQSALGLFAEGRQVFVVADAVGSRDPDNRALALERLRDNGIDIVTREMVAYEWLGRGGTPQFRDVSREFLR
jgi:nicotinamidase-related amidase